MWTALLVIAILAIVSGALLGYASIKLKVEGNPLVEQVLELLPQANCGQCGMAGGCQVYAENIVLNGTAINLCPPGGSAVMEAIAQLLDIEPVPLEEGEGPVKEEGEIYFARIDENACIGCNVCYKVCPVDAIVGTAGALHTVMPAECTGCEACVSRCPVKCITMRPSGRLRHAPKWPLQDLQEKVS